MLDYHANLFTPLCVLLKAARSQSFGFFSNFIWYSFLPSHLILFISQGSVELAGQAKVLFWLTNKLICETPSKKLDEPCSKLVPYILVTSTHTTSLISEIQAYPLDLHSHIMSFSSNNSQNQSTKGLLCHPYLAKVSDILSKYIPIYYSKTPKISSGLNCKG